MHLVGFHYKNDLFIFAATCVYVSFLKIEVRGPLSLVIHVLLRIFLRTDV